MQSEQNLCRLLDVARKSESQRSHLKVSPLTFLTPAFRLVKSAALRSRSRLASSLQSSQRRTCLVLPNTDVPQSGQEPQTIGCAALCAPVGISVSIVEPASSLVLDLHRDWRLCVGCTRYNMHTYKMQVCKHIITKQCQLRTLLDDILQDRAVLQRGYLLGWSRSLRYSLWREVLRFPYGRRSARPY